MNKPEQNWQNFCVNHVHEWRGTWTRYYVQTETVESFQSLRRFRQEPDSGQIFQTNRYFYANGETEEQTWEFDQQNSLPDGLFHPQRESMRGFFLNQGAAAWVQMQVNLGVAIGIELFFRWDDLRHSVGIVYDRNGQLFRVASVREDAKNFPSHYWSTDTQLLNHQDFGGSWAGRAIALSSTLDSSTSAPVQFHWPLADHATFFFPDRISLSCPPQIPATGQSFAIAANWLATPTDLQQITVEYNERGAFSTLKLEMFQQ
jgi:Domain of unknown function (DUF3598)